MRKLEMTIDLESKNAGFVVKADDQKNGASEMENKITNILGHAITKFVYELIGDKEAGLGFGSTLEEAQANAKDFQQDSKLKNIASKLPTQ